MRFTIIVFSIMLISLMLMFFLTYNSSASVPVGLYLKLPFSKIEVGDTVGFSDPFVSGLFGVDSSNIVILKHVVKIEDGKYWLKGDSEKSYDSRYFGYLSKDYIIYEVKPLFTPKN